MKYTFWLFFSVFICVFGNSFLYGYNIGVVNSPAEVSHIAATRDFQHCGILTSVGGSDEPVQPPFKLSNSKCCSVSRIFKRLAKPLIRLRVCTCWAEPFNAGRTYHIVQNLMRVIYS